MYDAGKTLLEDVFLVEGEIFFDGVPAFAVNNTAAFTFNFSCINEQFITWANLTITENSISSYY